jgi:hypothetical protein
MQNKNKTLAITIALLLTLSMVSSMMLMPNANAHTPAWSIPTQAFIVTAPNTVGVSQTVHVYMWLAEVYGAAGGTTAASGTNASTASAGLLANNYRFHNYKLTITAPDGTTTTQTFDTITDTTSSQYTVFTPTQVGAYTFNFSFPGQVYGANGNGYEKSPLINDTYLPASASATLTVQQDPIPAAITSYPLPSAYWAHPIYGENTDWWTISSNWLGSGAGPTQGYGGTTFATLYHSDAVGPQTTHVMWTKPLQFGGVVGGNQFTAGGSYPSGAATGAQYYEGSSYQPRFTNPIIMNGYLFYTEPASFTGPSSGPTDCVDLRTGQVLWSRSDVPPLSFGYIFNLYDPDQHGVYPPTLVAANGANWQLYDAYTGDPLFNVTNIPASTSFTVAIPNTSPLATVAFSNIVASPNILGPNGEELRYVIANAGTAAAPQWYMAQWNMSKLWQYDVNPYTGGGSLSPDVINASNGVLVVNLPIPLLGETGTLPTGIGALIPSGSTVTVNANIPINSTTVGGGAAGGTAGNGITTYDWNISLPWLNTMTPPPATISAVSGQLIQPPVGANPVSIVAVKYGDVMLCRNGTLPNGFGATRNGYPQLPFTYFAVNLNASQGVVGSIRWMKNYNPPANNVSLVQGPVDFDNGVFMLNLQETMQWEGISLNDGSLLWGPTASQNDWDYYGYPGTTTLPGTVAYGNLYSSSFSGVCYAYNDLTGNIVFTYGNGGAGNSTNAGLQVFYGDYPTQIQSIANGVIYLATNEHTMPNPFYKGCLITAINATTGKEINTLSLYPSEWSTPGTAFVVADGYIACMNGLDNNIYSIGRGPSATTVTAPDLSAASGQPVVIRGTVTDISAGTQQAQQVANFPNGVPVSSDASMKDWMGYVYQQKPLPTNFTGVPVSITVIDSNGNHRTIGTVTTTSSGTYSLTWTPDISGDYTVIATFVGSNGYWPSSMQTAFNVMQAPAATAAPTPAPASMADLYILPGIIAIIIAIVIVGVVLALLMLRKHP